MAPRPSASARVLPAVSVSPWLGVALSMVTPPVGRHSRWRRPRSRRTHDFVRAVPVGVARFDRHHLADLGFGQDMPRRAAADHHAIGLPGVGDGAQAVRIGRVLPAVSVSPGWGGVVDGDRAGGASFTLPRPRSRAGHALRRAVAVGVAHGYADHVATSASPSVGYVAASADVAPARAAVRRALPQVAEAPGRRHRRCRWCRPSAPGLPWSCRSPLAKPVGASFTFPMAAVCALVRLSAVPWPSV